MRLILATLLALLTCASQAQVVPNTATITFIAPTARVDGTPIAGAVSYHVYQGVKDQPKAKVGTITATTSTINAGLLSETEYCWQVTAQEANRPESAMSNEACKAFGKSPSQTVTIVVQ